MLYLVLINVMGWTILLLPDASECDAPLLAVIATAAIAIGYLSLKADRIRAIQAATRYLASLRKRLRTALG